MRSERQPMRSGLRNIIIIQLILTAAVALGALAWRGQESALAAAYGGGIVLLNSFLLARRVRRAGELEGSSVAASMYAGAAQRFIIAAAAFGLGMGVLRLEPVPMIAAFAVAQFALVFAAQQQSP
jgi:ATP synthase protein I